MRSFVTSARAPQSGNLVHRARHGEGEDAALSGRRMYVDAAAVLLHDGAADGESQTGAAHRARVGCVNLLESLEDDFKLLRRDAASVVFHFEGDLVVAGRGCGQADLAAGMRELHRIADQVGERL